MSIADEIQALAADRTAIQNAILAKGGTVTSADGFDDFASAIATIPNGGGSGAITITANTNVSGNVEYVDPYGVPTERNGIILGDSLDVLTKSLIVVSTPIPIPTEPVLGMAFFQNATFIRTRQEGSRSAV